MTDTEIIKAFEICYTGDEEDCLTCPFCDEDGECMDRGDSKLLEEVGCLLNRQKAEIERLYKLQKPTKASGFKIEKGKVIFYTNMLNGYRYEYKDLEEVVKDLNLMLQNAYKSDEIISYYKCAMQRQQSSDMGRYEPYTDSFVKEMVGGTK